MKKFFLILFASFSLLALNSCKSDDEQIEDPVDTTPDYLLMHYGVGSTNLDDCISLLQ